MLEIAAFVCRQTGYKSGVLLWTLFRGSFKTSPFAQYLYQVAHPAIGGAQIFILKIFNVSLWLIRLRRIAFLDIDSCCKRETF